MAESSLIDVLLINPYVYAPKTTQPPLGLLSIASTLAAKDYNVKVIDMQLQLMDEVEAALSNMREDGLVGFGGASEGRRYVFEISKLAKESHPNCTVVYGGPHASFTAELTLERIKTIDVVVFQEGEITASELADCVLKKEGSLENIKGIAYRKDGEVIKTPPRPRIQDLDILVYDYGKFVDSKHYDQVLLLGQGKGLHFVSSRGCPYKCNFCSASLLWEHHITSHSSKRIVDEIEGLFQERPDINGILFADSTFTYNKSRVREICDEIKKRKLAFVWSCDTRANTVDYELLAYMKDAGCYVLGLGFESASQRVLDTIEKKATVEQSVRLFNWAEKLDMHVVVSVTFGHPTETYEEALYTLNFIKDYLSDNIHMMDPQPMRIYPGTELERFAIENNLLPEGFDWCIDYDYDPGLKRSTPYVPVLIQPQMGIPEFKALLAEFEKISKGGSDTVLPKSNT